MQVRVDYEDGLLTFEADTERLVAVWMGPPVGPTGDPRAVVRAAFDAPIGFPSLRLAVVPGDRVVVPLDPSLPEAPALIGVLAEILREGGVESITAIVDGRSPEPPPPTVEGVSVVVHDPSDRESLAYLATTESGRRIYLNRLLADADIVIPIGRLGYGPGGRLTGPWSVIDPGLSDSVPPAESLLAQAAPPDASTGDAAEVAWLLGCQLQVAAVPGRAGLLRVVAGEAKAVELEGRAALDSAWRFEADDRADLVIAGVGGPGRPSTADDLASALRQSLRLVRRGGKVALLSRVGSEAIRDLARGPRRPRGDWEKALAWADLYLLSNADPDEVEDLGLIPLENAEQAARLAKSSPSTLTLSQADRTLASARD